jgi:hypothetical protein
MKKEEIKKEEPEVKKDGEFDEMADEGLNLHPDRANIEIIESALRPKETHDRVEFSNWPKQLAILATLQLIEVHIVESMENFEKTKEREDYGEIIIRDLATVLRGKDGWLMDKAVLFKEIQNNKESSSTTQLPGQ